MEHILKILTLAENAGRIGIVLGPESGDTELLAAHALKERLGEKAVVLNAPEHLQDRWSHMFKKERPQKEFALVLDTDTNPVDELRYEKEGGKLRIFLSPQHELTKDAFQLEHRYMPSDMIIALGFANETDITRTLETDTPLKNTAALINLSHIPSEALKKDALPSTNKWDIGAMKLWSRALLRSYVEDKNTVFWAFLPKEDFQKTNQPTSILPALLAHMGVVMELPPLRLILWQDQDFPANNVHILVSGTDPDVVMQIAQAAETSVTNGNLTIRGFANFSEAEVEMRKLLKSIKPEA
ncbi:MAG: hypothetical protein A3J55_03355 [Candidatus Ryanbacteria bacterium RIFCSPHIGHO2_02_FULL_45_17b]|nr:MAG: hypothetical protein A3J55_03355 [Candidatus Ryanbacteria bacterium RIFCSPHIGHO2_02_FULL_45_17b]